MLIQNEATLHQPRVLQVITRLTLGGAERVALEIVRGMQGEFRFAVYAASGVDHGALGQSMKRDLIEVGVPLHVGTALPPKFGGILLSAVAGAKAVYGFRPDIIHLHTEIPEATYAAMVTLKPSIGRIPVVRTIHNASYWESWRRLGLWCDRRMARSYVACVSDAARSAFNQLRIESVAGQMPRPPLVVYNGVRGSDNEKCKPAPGAQVQVLYAGRFEKQKGVDLLPEILRLVELPEGIRCHLTAHGAGTEETVLRNLALSLPTGWTMDVEPPVPDLLTRLSGFDLLIMPSRFEGLGLMAVEAILHGLPVVATKAPGLVEAFPADYPFMAIPGDPKSFAEHLSRALRDPCALSRSAQQALPFARRRFNPVLMYDGYTTLYHQVLNDGVINSSRIQY